MSVPGEIVVGTVGRPWGTKGQFLVDPHGSDPAFLLARGRLRLRRRGRLDAEYPILASHRAGGRLVVGVEGCASPEDAALLRGAEVLIPAGEFEPAPEGSFYPHELTGLAVLLPDGGAVGVVERVLATAGPDLLRVRSAEREILIPFVESICVRVDLAARTIVIDPPAGLLELG